MGTSVASTTSTNNVLPSATTFRNGLLIFGGMILGSFITTLANAWLLQRRSTNTSRKHAPESQAQAIQNHLQQTQKTARALRILVQDYDEVNGQFLALQAPLTRNTNVHGTAFAGSLFSVGVLSSYYLARQYILKLFSQDKYVLVAKAANIQYRKPVTTENIVAKSYLPSEKEMNDFVKRLEAQGKATITVSGTIQVPKGDALITACEYAVECCAYRPRN